MRNLGWGRGLLLLLGLGIAGAGCTCAGAPEGQSDRVAPAEACARVGQTCRLGPGRLGICTPGMREGEGLSCRAQQ